MFTQSGFKTSFQLESSDHSDGVKLFLLIQIFKGDCQIPKSLSPSVQDLLRRILEPNPMKRIDISGIKEHEWFRKDYVPAVPHDDDEDILPGSILPVKEVNS
jgi:5'-AMP-activated protein kinase catalytic alpha subunit